MPGGPRGTYQFTVTIIIREGKSEIGLNRPFFWFDRVFFTKATVASLVGVVRSLFKMRYTPLTFLNVLSIYIDILAPTKNFLWRLKVESRQPVFHAVSRPTRISKFLPSKISIFMAKMTFEKIFLQMF